MDKPLQSEFRLDPEPGILIESLRDIGYSFNSALADIIDNSIAADSTQVSVLAIPTDDFRIAILDDGGGLSRSDLLRAMRLGSSDPREDRSTNDLGRFGLGLKTASFSQCRRLTVVSSQSGEAYAFTWDLDQVVKNNRWTVVEHSDISSIPFTENLGNDGTLVLWENLDRLTGSNGSGKVDYARIISDAQDYLSLVFHRYLSGENGLARLTVRVNNVALEAIDPFNSRNKATQSSPEELVCPGVTMQAYTLPHRSAYSSSSEYDKYGLKDGYLKNQGIYLYRAKRLILYGTWFGIVKKTNVTQLCRVKLDIGVNQDELWKIDVKKVSAQLPEIVRTRVRALINIIGAPSRKVYRRRGARLTSPDIYPTWTVIQDYDMKTYCINRKNPVIVGYERSLAGSARKEFEAVLSLIESSFPTEALFYDLGNDDKSVEFEAMNGDAFDGVSRKFFTELRQQGNDQETVFSIMKNAEPFASRWNEVVRALEIEELR